MKPSQVDRATELLASLRPSKEELASLHRAERAADPAEFERHVERLDRKYKARTLEAIKGIDQKLINRRAYRRASEGGQPSWRTPVAAAAIVASLVGKKLVTCECIVPFRFRGLHTFGSMAGADGDQAQRGVVGAHRYYDDEYTVANYGDTEGRMRLHLDGQMQIEFGAELPKTARYCLICPSGHLVIRGRSRVAGRGNFAAADDARIRVDFHQAVQAGDVLLELCGGNVHSDGARTSERTGTFAEDVYLEPRYLFLEARANDLLRLTLRLEIEAEANVDGVAVAVVDTFGFFANSTRDHDTFVLEVP